jgi:flagellar basal-body rod modification protein FlgD
MTQIDAISSARSAPTTNVNNKEQFGKDTFLKLLVAQLKYQNPMSPTDGTQFLAQTAQFTMIEKLDQMNAAIQSNAASNEVLEAASMIGKHVSVATKDGAKAVTTVDHLGGQLSSDAAEGTVVKSTSTLYTKQGTQVPVTIELTKGKNGADGSTHWKGRVMLQSQQLGSNFTVDFDSHGDRTSANPQLTMADLDAVPAARGMWDSSGVTFDFGGADDPRRLRTGSGSSSFTEQGQNGTDGSSVTGVVTGARFTADGPRLTINGKEYALSDVTDVHVDG